MLVSTSPTVSTSAGSGQIEVDQIVRGLIDISGSEEGFPCFLVSHGYPSSQCSHLRRASIRGYSRQPGSALPDRCDEISLQTQLHCTERGLVLREMRFGGHRSGAGLECAGRFSQRLPRLPWSVTAISKRPFRARSGACGEGLDGLLIEAEPTTQTLREDLGPAGNSIWRFLARP